MAKSKRGGGENAEDFAEKNLDERCHALIPHMALRGFSRMIMG